MSPRRSSSSRALQFEGVPEHAINFFFLLAEEIRGYMAAMGYRTFDEMIGQTHRLEVDQDVISRNPRAAGLDLSPLLTPAAELNPDHWGIVKNMEQDHGLAEKVDNALIAQAAPALERGEKVEISLLTDNLHRTLGTMLSRDVSLKYGVDGLPDDTIVVNLTGHAGQSLGMCLAPGITLNVVGDANDGVGKSLSGGKIVVAPGRELLDAQPNFRPEEHVVVGNVAGYGASRGQARATSFVFGSFAHPPTDMRGVVATSGRST